MEKLQIFTPNQKRWNSERSVPELGLISINEQGYAEINESQYAEAKQLEAMQVDYFLIDSREKVDSKQLFEALKPGEEDKKQEEDLDKDEIKKVEKNDIPEQTEQNDLGSTEDSRDADISLLSKEAKEKLQDMNVDELKDYTKQFPEVFDASKVKKLDTSGRLRKYIFDSFKKLASTDLIK